jgi:hypothetical protein
MDVLEDKARKRQGRTADTLPAAAGSHSDGGTQGALVVDSDRHAALALSFEAGASASLFRPRPTMRALSNSHAPSRAPRQLHKLLAHIKSRERLKRQIMALHAAEFELNARATKP